MESKWSQIAHFLLQHELANVVLAHGQECPERV